MKEKRTTRLKLKRISRYVIIFCLIFLVILAGFTLYGDKVGNFTVVLKEDKVKISACLTKDLANDKTSRFDVPGIEYLSATTYQEIPQALSSGIGIKNDEHKKYMAFSFFLLNLSDHAIAYDLSGEILDELAGKKDKTCKPSDALRILILTESDMNDDLEGSASLKEDGVVYAKQEDSQAGLDELKAANYPEGKVTYFSDERVIVKQAGISFDTKAIKKYTVVLWLEGYDISCRDELIGGRLKLRMNFNAYEMEGIV